MEANPRAAINPEVAGGGPNGVRHSTAAAAAGGRLLTASPGVPQGFNRSASHWHHPASFGWEATFPVCKIGLVNDTWVAFAVAKA